MLLTYYITTRAITQIALIWFTFTAVKNIAFLFDVDRKIDIR